MKILLFFLVTGISTTALSGNFSKKQIDEANSWRKKTAGLEKVISQAGWKKPSKNIPLLPEAIVLENPEQSEPAAFILRSRDIASKQAPSVKASARHACRLAQAQSNGEMFFKFDEKTESGNCWVIHPVDQTTKVQKHSFVKVRSVLKGSKAFTIENALISTDMGKSMKGPHPAAVKIAKAMGAK